MRRAVTALALLALAGAVFVSARPTDEAHAATTCTRHTKRVVRHVKRHGKRKKVVHLKHYWTCEEVTESVAPTPAAPSSPVPPPASPQATPEPEPNALGVAAEDQGGLRYTLSRDTVRAGQLVVQLNDKGEDPHTMEMERVGPTGEPEGPVVAMLETEPGEQETVPVEVQPGTYKMWCTIGEHAKHGMRAEITVE